MSSSLFVLFLVCGLAASQKVTGTVILLSFVVVPTDSQQILFIPPSLLNLDIEYYVS